MSRERGSRGGHPLPLPSPPGGGPNLLGLLTNDTVTTQVPDGGVSASREEPDQPPSSLCAPPHVEQNCDPVRREPSLLPRTQIRHVFCISVSQWLSPLNIPVLTRGRAENHWMAAYEVRTGTLMALTTYGTPLANTPSFK